MKFSAMLLRCVFESLTVEGTIPTFILSNCSRHIGSTVHGSLPVDVVIWNEANCRYKCILLLKSFTELFLIHDSYITPIHNESLVSEKSK